MPLKTFYIPGHQFSVKTGETIETEVISSLPITGLPQARFSQHIEGHVIPRFKIEGLKIKISFENISRTDLNGRFALVVQIDTKYIGERLSIEDTLAIKKKLLSDLVTMLEVQEDVIGGDEFSFLKETAGKEPSK